MELLSDISSEDSRSPEGKMRSREMNASFKHLFETKLMSDYKLIVGDRVIEAHRIVLTTFSTYFKTMFDPEYKYEECTSGEIKIKDFSYDEVYQMLEYMYTGSASKISQMPVELLRIADKHDVKLLQSKCSKVLIPMICVKNVLEMLVLAEETGADNLEFNSLTFVKKNYEDVRKTVEWTKFCRDHSSLLDKITDAIANYSPPKKRKL